MLMSMTFAPPSTWSRATLIASRYSSSSIRSRNFRDPITLVRSPTMMKFEFGR